MEGRPKDAYWQAQIAAADLLTEAETAEDDWWVEAYDATEF